MVRQVADVGAHLGARNDDHRDAVRAGIGLEEGQEATPAIGPELDVERDQVHGMALQGGQSGDHVGGPLYSVTGARQQLLEHVGNHRIIFDHQDLRR